MILGPSGAYIMVAPMVMTIAGIGSIGCLVGGALMY